MWVRVEITTVRQLGELRELFKGAPGLAALIRSFRLLWHMDGDCTHYRLEPMCGFTALDCAFRNRLEIFNRRVKTEAPYLDHELLRCGDGSTYEPPGSEPDWVAVAKVGPLGYDWLQGARGSGPDGKGEDKLIKNATQFTQCINEVVNLLTSLETFGWETKVSPMPQGVFDALARLTTLTDLRLVFSTFKTNLSERESLRLGRCMYKAKRCV